MVLFKSYDLRKLMFLEIFHCEHCLGESIDKKVPNWSYVCVTDHR